MILMAVNAIFDNEEYFRKEEVFKKAVHILESNNLDDLENNLSELKIINPHRESKRIIHEYEAKIQKNQE